MTMKKEEMLGSENKADEEPKIVLAWKVHTIDLVEQPAARQQ